jgi:hypothetical protein
MLIWLRAFGCIGAFWLCLMTASKGQENRPTPLVGDTQAAKTNTDFIVRIGVEEVRIDAVVLDKKGRQVADLTGDDFRIYQDGSTQEITSCTYINDYRPQPGI